MFRTIGPVWDGNEVWLVVAGGAMFAAFPTWYATMFSGFYVALLLLLVFLIVRVLSFEWRERHEHSRWLGVWAWANTIGSLGAALIWGVAFSNLLYGVPINSSGDFDGTLLGPLQPVHAARRASRSCCCSRSTERPTSRCARPASCAGAPRRPHGRLSIATAVVGAGFLIWTVAVAVDRNDKDVFPPLLPALLAIVALLGAAVCVRLARSGWAFVLTAAGAFLVVATIFTSLYPRVMVASNDFANSLTVDNASSAHYTLKVMSVVALTVVPIILLYQAWTYHVFRARLSGEDEPCAGRSRPTRDRRVGAHGAARPAPGPPRGCRAGDARARRRSRRRRRAAGPRPGRPDRHRRGPRLRRGGSRRADRAARPARRGLDRPGGGSLRLRDRRQASCDRRAGDAAPRARRATASRSSGSARRRRERRGGDGGRGRSRRARDDVRALSAAGRPRGHRPARRPRLRRHDRPRLRRR